MLFSDLSTFTPPENIINNCKDKIFFKLPSSFSVHERFFNISCRLEKARSDSLFLIIRHPLKLRQANLYRYGRRYQQQNRNPQTYGRWLPRQRLLQHPASRSTRLHSVVTQNEKRITIFFVIFCRYQKFISSNVINAVYPRKPFRKRAFCLFVVF